MREVTSAGNSRAAFSASIESVELVRLRQLAMDEEKRHFLKCRFLGEVMDRIAAIGEGTGLAVDIAGARTFEINAFQATVDFNFLFVWHSLFRGAVAHS